MAHKAAKTEHYFTAQPHSQAVEREIRYTARGHEYTAAVSDGVFSAHDLDMGTRVLLTKVPSISETAAEASAKGEENKKSQQKSGEHNALSYPRLCVDVGCGWGPLTLALAKEYPRSHVLAVDVNERALHLTEKNARANECINVTVEQAEQALAHLKQQPLDSEAASPEAAHHKEQHPAEQRPTQQSTAAQSSAPEYAAQYVDLIWSNPPIRIGKKELHQLLTNWLKLLRPGTGRAYWVVQKNLGADSLTAWLTANGYPSKKIASQKGYRVIESAVPLER